MTKSVVKQIAVTGAAGSLAADIIPRLRDAGYGIRGIDQHVPESSFGCEWIECSITDRLAIKAALAGCDAVIHLAGIPLEAEWSDLLHANIDGTYAVLEAARLVGIRRVVLASSIHAAGFVEVPSEGTVPDDVAIRPNTLYGVTKATVEALGNLYHDRYGMDVFCLRIASRFTVPLAERMLSTWLSPADAARLFDACLRTDLDGFHFVWGVSANTRSYLSSAGGSAIGYFPQDNAEGYADKLFEAGRTDPTKLASEWDERFIGGDFCSPTPPRMAVPALE